MLEGVETYSLTVSVACKVLFCFVFAAKEPKNLLCTNVHALPGWSTQKAKTQAAMGQAGMERRFEGICWVLSGNQCSVFVD